MRSFKSDQVCFSLFKFKKWHSVYTLWNSLLQTTFKSGTLSNRSVPLWDEQQNRVKLLNWLLILVCLQSAYQNHQCIPFCNCFWRWNRFNKGSCKPDTCRPESLTRYMHIMPHYSKILVQRKFLNSSKKMTF